MTTACILRETSDRFFKVLLALRTYKTPKDGYVYILQKNSAKETMIYIQKEFKPLNLFVIINRLNYPIFNCY